MILRYFITILFLEKTLRGIPRFQMLCLAFPDLINPSEASEPARILSIITPDEELLQREPDFSHQVDRNEE